MKTIHKFTIPQGASRFKLALPRFSDILKIDVQRGVPTMWVLLDDKAPPQEWSFQVALTGGDALYCHKHTYLGTFMLDDGAFVGHVFLGVEDT